MQVHLELDIDSLRLGKAKAYHYDMVREVNGLLVQFSAFAANRPAVRRRGSFRP